MILEGLLSMVTELKEKQEAQVTPAGREETLSRLEAIERALSELRREPGGSRKRVARHPDPACRTAEIRTGTTAIFRGGQELCSSHFRLSQGNAGNNEAHHDERMAEKEEAKPVPFHRADLQQSNFFGSPEAIPLFGRSDCLCHVPVPECPSWLNGWGSCRTTT